MTPLRSLLLLLPALLLGPLLPGPAAAQDGARARELNEQGVARFREGDVEGALSLFRDGLLVDPQHTTLRHNASRCLMTLGDRRADERRYREAAADYHAAGGLVPDDPEPPLREAQALLADLRDRDAVAVLERVIRGWPEDARGHRLLGEALYRQGNTRRAIQHWERALGLAPGDEDLRAALAQVRREDAVEAELYEDLGAAHFRIKYDGARDQALGRHVTDVLEGAYNEVGLLLGRYPDHEVAVVVYPGRSFQELTGAHGWVAGLYDGKIRVPAGGLGEAPPAEVRRVLTHEYAHALVRAVGGTQVPIWLHEGLAQVAEGRSQADARRELRRGQAPGLEALGRSFVEQAPDAERARLLYAAACDFVHSLLARGGPPLLAEVLDRLGRGEALEEAIRAVYGLDLEELHAAWLGQLPE